MFLYIVDLHETVSINHFYHIFYVLSVLLDSNVKTDAFVYLLYLCRTSSGTSRQYIQYNIIRQMSPVVPNNWWELIMAISWKMERNLMIALNKSPSFFAITVHDSDLMFVKCFLALSMFTLLIHSVITNWQILIIQWHLLNCIHKISVCYMYDVIISNIVNTHIRLHLCMLEASSNWLNNCLSVNANLVLGDLNVLWTYYMCACIQIFLPNANCSWGMTCTGVTKFDPNYDCDIASTPSSVVSLVHELKLRQFCFHKIYTNLRQSYNTEFGPGGIRTHNILTFEQTGARQADS